MEIRGYRWGTAEEPLNGDALIARERHRCKEVGQIIFGFSLHDEQVDAIRTFFFEQRDLLLLAKTGFGKSLIFQLLPFMTPVLGLVLILMPLKLLQAKQSIMINRIANAKSIVLNGDNNLAAWGLRGKGGEDGSSAAEKGEDRGDEGLSVGGCRAGAGVAGELSASALRLLPLVWGMIGYRLHYSDGG